MAKKGKNKIVWLECTECGNKNYSTFYSKEAKGKEKKGKLELSKHCKHCRKHTPHKESK